MGTSQNTQKKTTKSKVCIGMHNTSEHPTRMPLISTHAGREIWSDKPFYLDARDPTQLFIVICIELEAKKNIFLETKTIHALFTTLAAEVAASATHSTQDGRTKRGPGHETTNPPKRDMRFIEVIRRFQKNGCDVNRDEQGPVLALIAPCRRERNLGVEFAFRRGQVPARHLDLYNNNYL